MIWQLLTRQYRWGPGGLPEWDGDDYRRRLAATIAAAVALAVLGAITFFVIHSLIANNRLQDCVLAGHHNCAPIEAPRQRL